PVAIHETIHTFPTRRSSDLMRHERSLHVGDLNQASKSIDTEPGGVAQADELWQQMLALCPPHHQPLLELKRQGCSLADIAERSGDRKSTRLNSSHVAISYAV